MTPRRLLDRVFPRRQNNKKKAFTLIEILVSVGIIGVLAGVTIQAIAPRKSILAANDITRTQTARHIEKAMYQYLVDEWTLPNESQIPEGEANAKQICAQGVSNATCANIDPLISPEYVAFVPRDEMEPCALYTGYKVYQRSGRPFVIPRFLGKLPGDDFDAEDCGNPEPPTLVPYLILDDGDAGYYSADCSATVSIGYQDDYRVCPTYLSTPLFLSAEANVPVGTYTVYATWVANSNLPDVTYQTGRYQIDQIVITGTVVKSQSSAPDDGQYGGSLWEEIGTVTTINTPDGPYVVVRVEQGPGGPQLIADAFMLVAQ